MSHRATPQVCNFDLEVPLILPSHSALSAQLSPAQGENMADCGTAKINLMSHPVEYSTNKEQNHHVHT